MRISYDPNKRAKILNEREIDIADAGQVFDGFHLTRRDDAHSDVETRYISVGQLGGAVVILVWTEREDSRRVVTMRKANGKERETYFEHRKRSG